MFSWLIQRVNDGIRVIIVITGNWFGLQLSSVSCVITIDACLQRLNTETAPDCFVSRTFPVQRFICQTIPVQRHTILRSGNYLRLA